MLAHQKMTGHFLVGRWKKEKEEWLPLEKGPLADKMNAFIHLVFKLDNGKMMALSNMRKFARIELWDRDEFEIRVKNKK